MAALMIACRDASATTSSSLPRAIPPLRQEQISDVPASLFTLLRELESTLVQDNRTDMNRLITQLRPIQDGMLKELWALKGSDSYKTQGVEICQRLRSKIETLGFAHNKHKALEDLFINIRSAYDFFALAHPTYRTILLGSESETVAVEAREEEDVKAKQAHDQSNGLWRWCARIMQASSQKKACNTYEEAKAWWNMWTVTYGFREPICTAGRDLLNKALHSRIKPPDAPHDSSPSQPYSLRKIRTLGIATGGLLCVSGSIFAGSALITAAAGTAVLPHIPNGYSAWATGWIRNKTQALASGLFARVTLAALDDSHTHTTAHQQALTTFIHNRLFTPFDTSSTAAPATSPSEGLIAGAAVATQQTLAGVVSNIVKSDSAWTRNRKSLWSAYQELYWNLCENLCKNLCNKTPLTVEIDTQETISRATMIAVHALMKAVSHSHTEPIHNAVAHAQAVLKEELLSIAQQYPIVKSITEQIHSYISENIDPQSWIDRCSSNVQRMLADAPCVYTMVPPPIAPAATIEGCAMHDLEFDEERWRFVSGDGTTHSVQSQLYDLVCQRKEYLMEQEWWSSWNRTYGALLSPRIALRKAQIETALKRIARTALVVGADSQEHELYLWARRTLQGHVLLDLQSPCDASAMFWKDVIGRTILSAVEKESNVRPRIRDKLLEDLRSAVEKQIKGTAIKKKGILFVLHKARMVPFEEEARYTKELDTARMTLRGIIHTETTLLNAQPFTWSWWQRVWGAPLYYLLHIPPNSWYSTYRACQRGTTREQSKIRTLEAQISMLRGIQPRYSELWGELQPELRSNRLAVHAHMALTEEIANRSSDFIRAQH